MAAIPTKKENKSHPGVNHHGNNDSKYNHHIQLLDHYSTQITKQLRVTGTELLFILLFVINFAVARVIHYLAQQEEVYNYYNDKRNIFNQWFVKKGWGWTTLVIILFYALVLSKSTQTLNKGKVISGAIIRYFLATGWWILFTQWCFGLPIMDKVFVLTGGKCTDIDQQRLNDYLGPHASTKGIFKVVSAVLDDVQLTTTEVFPTYETAGVTSYACRKLKGVWSGGHDPSGHVFLLVHSSLYLFWETAPFFVSWRQFITNIKQLWRGLNDRTGVVQHLRHFVLNNPHIVVVLLVWLWWFMLFMTNMYFHLSAEKSVGLLFGYFGAFAVYYAPRWWK